MPQTIIKQRIFPNKNRIKIGSLMDNTKSNLPQDLRISKHKFLSGNGFNIYN